MKRVALCYSGIPRFWHFTYLNILENLIKCNPDYQFDIFMCIQTSFKKSTSKVYKQYEKSYSTNAIISLYNPKKYKIKNDGYQFDKVYETFLLKQQYELEHNFTYDIVFRMRFEIIFNIPVKLNELIITDNTIYCIDYCKNKLSSNLLFDQVNALNKNIINKSTFIDNIKLNNHKLIGNYGIIDWFFFGNSQSMNFFIPLYQQINYQSLVFSKKNNISHELYVHIGIYLSNLKLESINYCSFYVLLTHLFTHPTYSKNFSQDLINKLKTLNHEGIKI